MNRPSRGRYHATGAFRFQPLPSEPRRTTPDAPPPVRLQGLQSMESRDAVLVNYIRSFGDGLYLESTPNPRLYPLDNSLSFLRCAGGTLGPATGTGSPEDLTLRQRLL